MSKWDCIYIIYIYIYIYIYTVKGWKKQSFKKILTNQWCSNAGQRSSIHCITKFHVFNKIENTIYEYIYIYSLQAYQIIIDPHRHTHTHTHTHIYI